MSNTIKNFLKFYFNPEILCEEEAKAELEEMGENTGLIEVNFKNYLKKVEARKKLLEAGQKKEQFEKNLEEYKKQFNGGSQTNNESNKLRLAARKGNENINEGDDAALLEFLKKNKLE